MTLQARSLGRTVLVWLATTTASASAALIAIPALHPATGGGSFAGLLTQCCGAVLLVMAGWFWLTSTAVATSVLAGRAHQRVLGCPDALRRGLLLACGVAVTGALSVPVQAASVHAVPGHPQPPAAAQAASNSLSGLLLPDRLAAPLPAHHAGAPAQVAAQIRHQIRPQIGSHRAIHVVAAGDTLWAIAAAQLPPDAGQARVAGYWQLIYAANRDVIGDDPDLIQPGERLVLPPPPIPQP
ncbi:MAG: LysM domain-containing protein [Nocardioides sp.]|jgi:hypothetical protein